MLRPFAGWERTSSPHAILLGRCQRPGTRPPKRRALDSMGVGRSIIR